MDIEEEDFFSIFEEEMEYANQSLETATKMLDDTMVFLTEHKRKLEELEVKKME